VSEISTSTSCPPAQLQSPQQLPDGWLITSWNVYCRRAVSLYSLPVFSVVLCSITSPITHTWLWLESVFICLPPFPQLPSSNGKPPFTSTPLLTFGTCCYKFEPHYCRLPEITDLKLRNLPHPDILCTHQIKIRFDRASSLQKQSSTLV